MAKVTSMSENSMTPIEIITPCNDNYESQDKIFTVELEEQQNNKDSYDGSSSNGNSSQDYVNKLSNQNSKSSVNQNQIVTQQNISDLSLHLENHAGDFQSNGTTINQQQILEVKCFMMCSIVVSG